MYVMYVQANLQSLKIQIYGLNVLQFKTDLYTQKHTYQKCITTHRTHWGDGKAFLCSLYENRGTFVTVTVGILINMYYPNKNE